DDGTVMRGPEVATFAEAHGLRQVSVADLIAYRQRKETLIEQVGLFDIETPFGKAKGYTYTLPWDPMQHLAVVFGDIRDGIDIPVRLHLENVGGDVFGAGRQIETIMKRISEQGRGVIVYLREGSVGVGVSSTERKGKQDREGHDEAQARESEW